jgi:hypothetical protein
VTILNGVTFTTVGGLFCFYGAAVHIFIGGGVLVHTACAHGWCWLGGWWVGLYPIWLDSGGSGSEALSPFRCQPWCGVCPLKRHLPSG